MYDPRRRRFNKYIPPQAGNAPARPPVTHVSVTEAKGVKRRQVLTAKPTGEIILHPWNDFETARTNLAIEKAVATENLWKRK